MSRSPKPARVLQADDELLPEEPLDRELHAIRVLVTLMRRTLRTLQADCGGVGEYPDDLFTQLWALEMVADQLLAHDERAVAAMHALANARRAVA